MTIFTKKITAAAIGLNVAALLVVVTFAGTALAQVNVNSSTGAGIFVRRSASTTRAFASTTRQTGLTNAADVEINNRVKTLQALVTRIQGMKFVSAGEQTTLQNEIQTQISNMTSLQSEIAAATSTASVRTDRQSITGDYRIYALVVPQTTIVAAVDRVENIVSMMTTLGGKLQSRLATSTVSVAVQSDLSDFNAKVSDADTQAKAAQTEVTGLTPDNGNQTTLASNTAALKDARSKIQTATKDLTAARKDAAAILKALDVS